MTRTLLAAIIAAAAFAAPAMAQSATPAPARASAHKIVVKMLDLNGGSQFAFDPATINAQPGDTVEFVQTGTIPHNVAFRKEAQGAKLGAAMDGQYISGAGQTYDLVIDARFTAGTYTFACDPHESMGMKGTLVVSGAPSTVVAAHH